MKTIKEKAEAYDKAIEIIRKHNTDKYGCIIGIKPSDIFSELKESKDERIIRVIRGWIYTRPASFFDNGISKEEILDWLEKQSEQKPTDKVEPKFDVGQWIVQENVGVYQVIEVCESWYEAINNKGKDYSIGFNKEYMYHPWTIQDAKDGDVLATDNGLAFIYNGYLEEQQWPFAYGGINIYGRFNICDGLLPFTHQKIVPATKEQRDVLMKAMTDAGYTFDFEKKELKKVGNKNLLLSDFFKAEYERGKVDKQKSVEWSKEDEEIIELLNEYVKNLDIFYSEIKICGKNIASKEFREKVQHWIKTLKERVQTQPKQEWSEEDEYYRNVILYCLNNESVGKTDKENAIIWFKSLRPQNNITNEELAQAKKDAYNNSLDKIEYHSGEPTFDDGWSAAIDYIQKKFIRPQNTWVPTEEQMEFLYKYAEQNNYDGSILTSLYNDLKKLKKE